MDDTNNWQRYYGEERVKRAELEVATDELVTAAEMVLACIDQPKGRDNSEHDGLDAAEALRKATAEVKEFNSATLQYVHGLAAGDPPMMGDLVMLVARLARKLRKAAPADELPAQALDYLNRNGLKGSPLREGVAGGTATVTREMIGAAHDVMLAKGDFVLSAALLERIYLAMEQAAPPPQTPFDTCPTCEALARTVMMDQVSFDRKPDCYGIRQITDDEGVEEWEDIRTSPDVAREEANDMMATGRGEIYEVVPLWTTPQPSPTAQAKPDAGVLEDAARYRWLRDESWAGYHSGDGTPKVYTMDGAGNRKMQLAEGAMDAAIDAARKQGANHD